MTPLFLLVPALFWLLLLAGALGLADGGMRRLAAWAFLLAPIAAGALFGPELAPGERLLAASAGLLYLVKGFVLLRLPRDKVRRLPKGGLLLHLTVWPGIDPAPFRQRRPGIEADAAVFFHGYRTLLLGAALGIATLLLSPRLPAEVVGWAGLLALLLAVHGGYAQMLTYLLRAAGWNVGPLFDRPFRSRSLHDFWSRRWNLAFVEMGKFLFWTPLRRAFGPAGAVFGIFLASGLLHEAAISYPAGGGWGGPFLYFALQGALVLAERRLLRGEQRWNAAVRAAWTWFWLLAPAPLLFPAPFREAFLVPLFRYGHAVVASHPAAWWFDLALWLAAAGHFCAIGAGIQLPARLNWRHEAAKLAPFTRKIFWNYYATLGLILVAFGTLGFVLHAELLRGDRAALALAGLIATFWTMRIGVDFLYFEHGDWPPGPQFVLGHALLTTLFLAMAATLWGLIAWHAFA